MWVSVVDGQFAPLYENGTITVGKQLFDVKNGKQIN
jgi:hypothetical protein